MTSTRRSTGGRGRRCRSGVSCQSASASPPAQRHGFTATGWTRTARYCAASCAFAEGVSPEAQGRSRVTTGTNASTVQNDVRSPVCQGAFGRRHLLGLPHRAAPDVTRSGLLHQQQAASPPNFDWRAPRDEAATNSETASAAVVVGLLGRAYAIRVGAEHAAVPRKRAYPCRTRWTCPEELTGVRRHLLARRDTTFGARERRNGDHGGHRITLAGVAGSILSTYRLSRSLARGLREPNLRELHLEAVRTAVRIGPWETSFAMGGASAATSGIACEASLSMSGAATARTAERNRGAPSLCMRNGRWKRSKSAGTSRAMTDAGSALVAAHGSSILPTPATCLSRSESGRSTTPRST